MPVEALVGAPVEIPVEASAEAEQEQAAQLTPRELLVELETRFEVFRACLPLSIGIDKAIRARWPEVERKILRVALSMHTHGNRYLRALVKATQRFDLDGQPAEALSEEHRQFAATTLNERLQRQAEERRERAQREREERRAREPAGPDGQGRPGVFRRGKKPAGVKNAENAASVTNAEGVAESEKNVDGQASLSPASPASHPSAPRRKRPAKSGARPGKEKTSAALAASLAGQNEQDNQASQPNQTSQANPTSLAEKLALLAAKYGRQ
jgi:ProP effector